MEKKGFFSQFLSLLEYQLGIRRAPELPKINEKSIYELELHESVTIDVTRTKYHVSQTEVIRVPGGWIYISAAVIERPFVKFSTNLSKVFVPYSEELKK